MQISSFNPIALLMYVGIFFFAALWARRAWLLGIHQRANQVTDWVGEPLTNGQHYIRAYLLLNLIGTSVLLVIAVITPLLGLPFKTWTSLAALTIWCYFFAQHLYTWHNRRRNRQIST